MKLSHTVKTEISRSPRARQVEALFDVPASEKTELSWEGDVPIEDRDWSIGLIVGPSGCGKSTVARELFGDEYHPEMRYEAPSVLDDVDPSIPVNDVAKAFSSVGFSTVPAWLRPYHVLSNGERFRADIARRLLELEGTIVVDEFTSVVDRQVAQVGSHAIQKYARRTGKRFVAVTCHYDVEEWLQPDWVLEPSTMAFRWRSLRRRPELNVTIRRVEHRAWELFAPFHYLTADLNKSARCFCLFVDGRPASFAGILHMPHPKVRDIKRVSRTATLPDWQGLGLAFVLNDTPAKAYAGLGYRLRNYPARPAYVKANARHPHWKMLKKAGELKQANRNARAQGVKTRPCAIFEWAGGAMPFAQAEQLISGESKASVFREAE